MTGQQREVDVLIRSQVGDHNILVAIECREHKRQATVEWVEQMVMKHATLPTSKLILVSRHGFSAAALSKARLLGVDAFALEEAEASDWAGVLGEPDSQVEMWALRILACSVVLASDGTILHRVEPETAVFDAEGKPRGRLESIVRRHTDGSASFTQALVERARTLGESIHGAAFRVRPPLFLMTLEGSLEEIDLIRIYLEAVNTGDLVFERSAFRNASVAVGRARSSSVNYTLTLVKKDRASGAMTVVDTQTGATHTVDVRVPEDADTIAFIGGLIRLPFPEPG
jgi:hypothetical protein